MLRTRWGSSVSHFLTCAPLQRLCAVSMIQAAVFTDTLHVENIHHPNLHHICPLSRLQKNSHKYPNDRPDGAKWRKPKNNIFLPPLGLPPASSQRSFPSPDMHGAHGEGFPLISSSPSGNQHFNNSLSAEGRHLMLLCPPPPQQFSLINFAAPQ